MKTVKRLLLILAGGFVGSSAVWAVIVVFFGTAMSIDDAIGFMWLGLFAGAAATWWLTRKKKASEQV